MDCSVLQTQSALTFRIADRPRPAWLASVGRARRGLAVVFGVSAALLSAFVDPSPAKAAALDTGYVQANGLSMYYEVHGAGDPVVVLHGAYMTTDMMLPLVERLAESRKVYVLDLQGHGRTADIDRPIRYETMADDVDAFMAALDLPRADIVGYSMGGGVALQLAIRHPDRIRRMTAAAAGFRKDALYPELHEMFAQMTPQSFAGTPWEKAYKDVAPNPENFETLVEKLLDLDTHIDDWPEADIASIAAPVQVLSGDADVIRPEHSVRLFRLVGGGPVKPYFMEASADELAILPGTTHLGIMERLDLVVPMVEAFLGKSIPAQ